jgi:23S rRNA G2445 N2-methylase RlmL
LPVKIIATDIDKTAVAAAKHNAQTAGVDHLIEFNVCPYEETSIPDDGGIIILNPPYGERMDAINTKPPSKDYRDSREAVVHGRKIILRKSSDRQDKSGHSGAKDFHILKNTYQGIGDFFKKIGGGYSGYIFTGNLEMIKKVGLRTKRRIVFYNGEIECRLLEYELYSGSQKRSDNGKQSSTGSNDIGVT